MIFVVGLIVLISLSSYCTANDDYIRQIDRTKCPISEGFVFALAENINAEDYVKYRLYTRLNTENYEIVQSAKDISLSNYNPKQKTIFLVHGYRSSPDSSWAILMKSAILQQYDYNVIIVNWKYGAEKFYAPYAIGHAYATGKEIAKMINLIINTTEATLNQFHLIGFSLGGQVVAFAGKNLNKVARITSLDPAGPCFILFSPKYRIHHTDAEFVDVIVTNAGGYGLARPAGHVYFYVNGGRTQKTCGSNIVSQIEIGDIDKLVLDGCSHNKAPKYFTETILKPQCLIIGHSCDDHHSFMRGKCADCGTDGKKCAIMGMDADEYITRMENKTHNFYVETNFDFPFCLFHYQITVKISNNEDGINQIGKLIALFEGENQSVLKYLDEHSQFLEPGGNYTYLITNSFDIDPLISIKLKWFRMSTEFTNNTNLFVECIKVVKMNNLLRDRNNVTSSFKSPATHIISGKEVIFHRSKTAC